MTNVRLQPLNRISCGRMLFLIVYEDGLLEDINAEMLEDIQGLSSFLRMDLFVRPNTVVRRTVDCFTFGGVVRLVNEDAAALLRDYEFIHEMTLNGLFRFRK